LYTSGLQSSLLRSAFPTTLCILLLFNIQSNASSVNRLEVAAQTEHFIFYNVTILPFPSFGVGLYWKLFSVCCEVRNDRNFYATFLWLPINCNLDSRRCFLFYREVLFPFCHLLPSFDVHVRELNLPEEHRSGFKGKKPVPQSTNWNIRNKERVMFSFMLNNPPFLNISVEPRSLLYSDTKAGHKSPPLVPVLSWIHPFHKFSSCFPMIMIHFNIILPSTTRSSEWPLPFRFSDRNLACISRLSHACCKPRLSYPRFVHPYILRSS
jgi:hypothetical protein